MALVQTQEEADRLNEEGTYGPYQAANGHLMLAPLRFPIEIHDGSRFERDYKVGDEIRYSSSDAWCDENCPVLGSPPDW